MAKKKASKDKQDTKHAAAEDTTMARKDAILNLKAILVRRRDALRSALAGDLSLLKELRSGEPGDVMDAALDSAQDEISSQLAEVESRELASIEHALERMRDGDYGLCEVCGCKIPMARLNALPYATICITCQREIERTGLSAASLREEAEMVSDEEEEVDVM
jgi:DnaK suppressor protein